MNDVIVSDATHNCNTSAANRPTFQQVRESAARAGLVISHFVTTDVAIVPSATTADETYVLTRVNGAWYCNCPAGKDGRRCWHQASVQSLEIAARGQAETPNPPPTIQPPPAPRPDTDHRFIAALNDLFPEAA